MGSFLVSRRARSRVVSQKENSYLQRERDLLPTLAGCSVSHLVAASLLATSFLHTPGSAGSAAQVAGEHAQSRGHCRACMSSGLPQDQKLNGLFGKWVDVALNLDQGRVAAQFPKPTNHRQYQPNGTPHLPPPSLRCSSVGPLI